MKEREDEMAKQWPSDHHPLNPQLHLEEPVNNERNQMIIQRAEAANQTVKWGQTRSLSQGEEAHLLQMGLH